MKASLILFSLVTAFAQTRLDTDQLKGVDKLAGPGLVYAPPGTNPNVRALQVTESALATGEDIEGVVVAIKGEDGKIRLYASKLTNGTMTITTPFSIQPWLYFSQFTNHRVSQTLIRVDSQVYKLPFNHRINPAYQIAVYVSGYRLTPGVHYSPVMSTEHLPDSIHFTYEIPVDAIVMADYDAEGDRLLP
jgi:hypothetical protein